MPLRSMAYILYNAARQGINDPELFENYEKQMPYCSDMTLRPREAFGGVYAYYRTGLGTTKKMKYFEAYLEKHRDKVRTTFLFCFVPLSKEPRANLFPA